MSRFIMNQFVSIIRIVVIGTILLAIIGVHVPENVALVSKVLVVGLALHWVGNTRSVID